MYLLCLSAFSFLYPNERFMSKQDCSKQVDTKNTCLHPRMMDKEDGMKAPPTVTQGEPGDCPRMADDSRL